MVDMSDFYQDPFSVPIPYRKTVVPVTPGSTRSAEYYAQAAKDAVAQSHRDVSEALKNEQKNTSVVSWLKSDNPLNTKDGSLNPFAQKVGDDGMTLTTKLLIGAVALGAFYLFLNDRRKR